jgi:hypothetical protein
MGTCVKDTGMMLKIDTGIKKQTCKIDTGVESEELVKIYTQNRQIVSAKSTQCLQ